MWRSFLWNHDYIDPKEYAKFVRGIKGKDYQHICQKEINFEREKIYRKKLHQSEEDRQIRKMMKEIGATHAKKYMQSK